MEKKIGYNRNLIGGKRPHKGITSLFHCKTFSERLLQEGKNLDAYFKRIGK